jgi:uncharacterized protein YecE (DUF72 family)
MSTRWHIGAKQLRGAVAAYAKQFDLLEVRVVASGESAESSAASGPGLSTLRRWRKSVPPSFDFAVVAGSHLARVRPGDDAEQEFEAARAAIDVLHARCFVLRTPPEVTPAAVWRERIAKLAARFPRDVTHFVWEPGGVWEIEDAAVLARACNLVLAVDPAREQVPAGPTAYLRLRALGETRSFGASALERIVAAVGSRREVFAIIETDSALVEAKRLRGIVRRMRSADAGGSPKSLRPRVGGIVVRDDEQE